jgi:RTX calcium-binding nonapeptide repeat (4 copies)
LSRGELAAILRSSKRLSGDHRLFNPIDNRGVIATSTMSISGPVRTLVLFLGAVLLGLAFTRWLPTATAGAAPTCLGRPATIVGHGVIHGTAHADVIVGSQGADMVIGGGGNDRICAAGGDDTSKLATGATGSKRA